MGALKAGLLAGVFTLALAGAVVAGDTVADAGPSAALSSTARASRLSAPALDGVHVTLRTQRQGPGTRQMPVPLGFTLAVSATPLAGRAHTDPVTDVKLTLARTSVYAGVLPVCTVATIAAADEDGGCPPAALVASGSLTAELWNPSSPTAAGLTCDPVLDIWNAGAGRLAVFARIPLGHLCGGLVTGALAPWTAKLTRAGTGVTLDLPLPPEISTNTAATGLFTGLRGLSLTFTRASGALGGRSLAYLGSTGCVKHRRHYVTVLSATDGHTGQLTRGSGNTPC